MTIKKDRFKPSVYGIGYLGAKGHTTNKRAYKIWQAILQRCYQEKFSLYHRYGGRGVTVCTAWHNYQVFAEWYEANVIEGYEIDKDKSGSNIYSPETCQFISKAENIEISHSKHYSLRSPEGEKVELFNLQKFSREHGLVASNLLLVLAGKRKHHKGWTKPIC